VSQMIEELPWLCGMEAEVQCVSRLADDGGGSGREGGGSAGGRVGGHREAGGGAVLGGGVRLGIRAKRAEATRPA